MKGAARNLARDAEGDRERNKDSVTERERQRQRKKVRESVSKRERQTERERDFFIDNLMVRIYSIIEMVWWTGLAPGGAHPKLLHFFLLLSSLELSDTNIYEP